MELEPKKYQCQVCGHIYDPKIGEPSQNIPAGTPFENLPEEWTCPVCGAPKGMYQELTEG
jgi:rubredoxin